MRCTLLEMNLTIGPNSGTIIDCSLRKGAFPDGDINSVFGRSSIRNGSSAIFKKVLTATQFAHWNEEYMSKIRQRGIWCPDKRLCLIYFNMPLPAGIYIQLELSKTHHMHFMQKSCRKTTKRSTLTGHNEKVDSILYLKLSLHFK